MTPLVWNPSVYLHSAVGWWPLGRLRPGSVVEGIQGVCVGYWIVGTGCLMFILCGWYTVRVSWSHHGVCLVMDLNVNLVWQHRYPPPQHSHQPHPTLFFLLCYLNTDNINKTSLCSLLWRFLSTIELVDMRKGFYKVDNTIVGRCRVCLSDIRYWKCVTYIFKWERLYYSAVCHFDHCKDLLLLKRTFVCWSTQFGQ